MNKRAAIMITRTMVADSFLRGRLGKDDKGARSAGGGGGCGRPAVPEGGMDKINEALDVDDEPDASQWGGVLEASALVVSLAGLLAFFGMIAWFMVIR